MFAESPYKDCGSLPGSRLEGVLVRGEIPHEHGCGFLMCASVSKAPGQICSRNLFVAQEDIIEVSAKMEEELSSF